MSSNNECDQRYDRGVKGGDGVVAVAAGGMYSNAICRLLANEGNIAPFCKAPESSKDECPVFLYFEGRMTEAEADAALDRMHGK